MDASNTFRRLILCIFPCSLTLLCRKVQKEILDRKYSCLCTSFSSIFSTRRHVPIWILFALPMTTASIILLQDEVSKIKYGTKRFNVLYKYAYAAFFFLLIVKIA